VILTGVSGSNISRRHEWSRLHMSGIGKVTKRFNPYNGLRTTLDHPSGGRPDSSHPGAPEELYFRFYFWNDENRMDCRIEGDKVPGIFGQYGMYWNSVGYYEGAYGNGGAPTNGRRSHKGGYSGWTMRQHMQLRPSDGNPLGNQFLRGLGTYAYHCDQQGSWGDLFPYGTEETGRVLIGPNQWVCIEQRVKVNAIRGLTIAEQTARIAAVEAEKAEKTAYYQARHEAARRAGKNPTGYEDNIAEWSAVPVPVYDRNGYDQWGNGEAVRDGILEAWINGVKVYSRTNVAYRRHPSIKVDGVWFDHLHGGNYDAEHDHEFAEANIVVARKYIGPIR
jgi:hypothetical protein